MSATTRRLPAAVAAGAMLMLATAVPASADRYTTEGDDAVAQQQQPTGGQPGTDESGTTPVGDLSYEPQPWTEYGYVPTCMSNDIEGGADALCTAATTTCPDEGDLRYRVYTREMSAQGEPTTDWEIQGTQCRGSDDPSGVVEPEITPEMVVREAQRAAPESVVHVEPATRSYVSVPNNFYADRTEVGETVHLFGEPIGITFAPTAYDWDFGDGATGSGAGVEGAEVGAPGAVEHAYTRAGDYDVTLTRTFSVTFTLPAGETITTPGQVESTSEPYPLTVGEVQSVVTDVR